MKSIYHILKQTISVFVKQDVLGRDVPALTYNTLKALIPVLALAYVVGGALGCGQMLEDYLRSTLESQPTVADYLVDFVHNYLANTRSQYILLIGLAMMMYTLHSLVERIEKTFDSIWGVPMRKLKFTLLVYPAIFLFCVLMILVAYGLNVAAIALAHSINEYGYISSLSPLVLQIATIVPLFAFLVFIYCVVPNTKVKLRYVLPSALLSSIVMSLLQVFYVKAQIALASYNVIYGSLASLPLFLLWMQLLWTICVFGGVLAYVLQQQDFFSRL